MLRAYDLSKSVWYYKPNSRQVPREDRDLEEKVRGLIQRFPTWGYRRLWAWLRYREGVLINRKKVYRLLKRRRWFCHQRPTWPVPRVKKSRSRTERSDQRWAIDITHIPCGRDGWGHLVAVIDCADRAIVGYRFALRGRAREAESALEDACLRRFGTIPKIPRSLLLRSDNGLVFQAKRFRQAARFYGLNQEFVTPYTPEQNGLIERFFRSLKEECVWLHNFPDFQTASRYVARWIEFYNRERPHSSLDYKSPQEWRLEQANKAS